MRSNSLPILVRSASSPLLGRINPLSASRSQSPVSPLELNTSEAVTVAAPVPMNAALPVAVDPIGPIISQLQGEIKNIQPLQQDAIERTVHHVFNEVVEVLSWIKQAKQNDQNVVLYYPRPLLKAIQSAINECETFIHYDDMGWVERLPSSSLKSSIVYISICCGMPDELQPAELERIVNSFKAKGASKIVVYLGEYEDVLRLSSAVESEQPQKQLDWFKKNKNLLEAFATQKTSGKDEEVKQDKNYFLNKFEKIRQDKSAFLQVVTHTDLKKESSYQNTRLELCANLSNDVISALKSDAKEHIGRKIDKINKKQKHKTKKQKAKQTQPEMPVASSSVVPTETAKSDGWYVALNVMTNAIVQQCKTPNEAAVALATFLKEVYPATSPLPPRLSLFGSSQPAKSSAAAMQVTSDVTPDGETSPCRLRSGSNT